MGSIREDEDTDQGVGLSADQLDLPYDFGMSSEGIPIDCGRAPFSFTVSAEIPAEPRSPYLFKPGPYSSHSLLLSHLPAGGEGRRVLDVGGGEGYLSRMLVERGYRVVCLAAPGTVAADIPREVEVIEADLDFETPPFAEGFSYVVCGDVLEHLRDPGKTLRWLTAQLLPGGRVVASLPNSGHWHFRWTVLRGRFPADDRGLFDRTHLHFYTWSGWQALFASAGLEITAVNPTAIPFGMAWGLDPDHIAVRTLERLSYELGRFWRTLFAYQFVAVARPVTGE